jgi:hypothetical protein
VQAKAGDLWLIFAAPSALTAATQSSTKILLSWSDNSSDETGFRIERSLLPASGFTEIATVGADETSYLSTGLSPNTTYYYRILSYKALEDSSYSNTDSATTDAQDTSGGFVEQDEEDGGGGGGCSLSIRSKGGFADRKTAAANMIILFLPALIFLYWKKRNR